MDSRAMWILNRAVLDHLASREAFALDDRETGYELYLARELHIRQAAEMFEWPVSQTRAKVLLIARDAGKKTATA